MTIVFAFLLAVAAEAGLIGIPLALLINSWFFKYSFILFDHASRGFDDPPVLDIKMMNPIEEQRPLCQLLLILLLAGAAYWIHGAFGTLAAAMVSTVELICLPASVAILGLEGNIFKAANPIAWAAMIRGLGPLYLIVLAVIFVDAFFLVALARMDVWLSIQIAAGLFVVLSIFSALGGALYERREQLGIQTWVSPEQEEEKERKQDHERSEKIVHDAYGLMRASRHVDAWQELQRWLDEHGHAVEAYSWLCDSVSTWEDSRYLTRLTQDHIERLLASNHAGNALDLVARLLSTDPMFRPKTAAATLQIAQLAARGGGLPKLARTLTSDFETRFPGDPRVAAAAELAQQLRV